MNRSLALVLVTSAGMLVAMGCKKEGPVATPPSSAAPPTGIAGQQPKIGSGEVETNRESASGAAGRTRPLPATQPSGAATTPATKP